MSRAWLTGPAESGAQAGFGVYVHVPFCRHRCGYCDFATSDEQDGLKPRYVAALGAVMARTSGQPSRTVTSVYIGGGTPTRLAPQDLVAVVEMVRRHHKLATDAEVTVECNPDDASDELFHALVAAGVNRLSVGAQSFAPHLLATLERTHGPDGPIRAVELARSAGLANVSLDLLYGTPGETDADWVDSLAQAIAAGVDHVSAYALTIHENTPFGQRVKDGSLRSPDPDVQRRRFDVARDVLADAGLAAYELSNWARSAAARSRHNILYWRHGDYLAYGVGAHGHLDGQRWWHHRSTPRYLDAVEAGEDGRAGQETLADDERALERLMLGLRLADGLVARDVPPLSIEGLERAQNDDLVTVTGDRLHATSTGWFLLDEAVRLLTSTD